MRLHLGFSLMGFALLSGCTVRTVEYRDRPYTTTVATTLCEPGYACANSYYWDEYRQMYVFYDGDPVLRRAGHAGSYPLPPRDVYVTYPPRGYVPPSSYRPPPNAYQPPPRYVPPPPGWYDPVNGSVVAPPRRTP